MATLKIVEDLDVFEERRPGVIERGKRGVIEKLLLQRREEALAHGIVPAMFESLDAAIESIEFFFGPELAARVRARGSTRVPEWTGLWWRRREADAASC